MRYFLPVFTHKNSPEADQIKKKLCAYFFSRIRGQVFAPSGIVAKEIEVIANACSEKPTSWE